MENEFDEYRIPVRKRFPVWKGTIVTLCTAVSVLFVKLMMCQNDGVVRSEKQWNDRLNDWKERAAIEGQRQLQKASNELSPQIDKQQTGIDSLRYEIKVLKN